MRDSTVLLFLLSIAGMARADSVPSEPPPPGPAPEAAADRAALEGDVAAAHYRVGPGDRLRIELWGLQELTQEIEVNAEGKLFVPRAGVFDAAGLTLEALRLTVEKQLHVLYPRERASLTLVKPRTFLVH